MKIPSVEEAEKLIEEAAELNPGPWIEHNKTARRNLSRGLSAKVTNCSMNMDYR